MQEKDVRISGKQENVIQFYMNDIMESVRNLIIVEYFDMPFITIQEKMSESIRNYKNDFT